MAGRLQFLDACVYDCTCSLRLLPPDQFEAHHARLVQVDHLNFSNGNTKTVLSKPDDSLAACYALAE